MTTLNGRHRINPSLGTDLFDIGWTNPRVLKGCSTNFVFVKKLYMNSALGLRLIGGRWLYTKSTVLSHPDIVVQIITILCSFSKQFVGTLESAVKFTKGLTSQPIRPMLPGINVISKKTTENPILRQLQSSESCVLQAWTVLLRVKQCLYPDGVLTVWMIGYLSPCYYSLQ